MNETPYESAVLAGEKRQLWKLYRRVYCTFYATDLNGPRSQPNALYAHLQHPMSPSSHGYWLFATPTTNAPRFASKHPRNPAQAMVSAPRLCLNTIEDKELQAECL
jgi:hypothetical protein